MRFCHLSYLVLIKLFDWLEKPVSLLSIVVARTSYASICSKANIMNNLTQSQIAVPFVLISSGDFLL